MIKLCRSCGAEYDDTAVFCSKCGAKFEDEECVEVTNELTQALQTAEDVKLELKNEESEDLNVEVLDNKAKALDFYIATAKKRGNLTPNQLIDQYKAIKTKLDEIITHQTTLENYNKEIENVYETEKKMIKGETPDWVYLSALIAAVVGLFIGNGFFGRIIAAIFLAVIAYFFLDYVVYKNCIYPFKKDKLIQEATEYREKKLAEIQSMIDKTKGDIDDCWTSKEMELYELAVPPQYQSYEAIECFISLLTSRRADTEKELFNLYEEEKHRREMEAMQQQQLQYSKDIISNQQEHTELMNQQSELLRENNTLARQNNAIAMQNNALAKQQVNISQQQLNIERKISRDVKYGNAISKANLVTNLQINQKLNGGR